MTTVLVTGAAGLIGSNFCHYLRKFQPSIKVIGIDNLSGGYKEHVPDDIIFYQTDLTDFDSIKIIFEQHRPQLIYHFAAYAAEGLSHFIRCFNYQNNLLATANLINLSIKYPVKRFIFTSSMAVYGEGVPPFKETDQALPVDPYGIAKYACEMDLISAGKIHGLDWCIIRPHNVYGPSQNIWDVYRNVIGIWMVQILNNEPITIYGDGEQERAFSYISDILEPLWKAGINDECSKQIFNLGGDDFIKLKDLSALLIKVVGRGGNPIYLEARHEVKHAYCLHDKARQLLGFDHQTNLEQGIEKFWNWVQQQPKRDRKFWHEYEIDQGLYSYWKSS